MKTKRSYIILTVTGLILLVPFIAMQITGAVNWSLFDFVVAAALLLGLGFSLDFALRKAKTRMNQVLFALAVLFIFFLIWADLAVGIFGLPWSGS